METDTLQAENNQLRVEIEALRADLAAVRDAQATQRRRIFTAGGALARLLVGANLQNSLKAWLLGLQKVGDPFPVDETADVIAAFLRRFIRLSMVSLAIAMVPLLLLLWQNILVREQNRFLQKQVEQNNTQIQMQIADNLIVRRAELLARIYETNCSNLGGELSCEPLANPRTRQEAIIAFARIELSRQMPPDLSSADLRDLDLGGAVLTGADFESSNLSGCNLVEADLRGAVFYNANLRHAQLFGANLAQADFRAADLEGALFSNEFIRRLVRGLPSIDDPPAIEADIAQADFRGVDLRYAIGLTQEQIDSAVGNENTQLRSSMLRPKQWSHRVE